jgi:hypothetical protein
VQDALSRILHAAHLQLPIGSRIGTVPVVLSAVDGWVENPSPILPSPLHLSSDVLAVVEGAKVFAESLFRNMSSAQLLTVRGLGWGGVA